MNATATTPTKPSPMTINLARCRACNGSASVRTTTRGAVVICNKGCYVIQGNDITHAVNAWNEKMTNG